MEDFLTKLFSEEYLKNNYQQFTDSNKETRIIMIDLKKFKKINDTFGHAGGDKYLIVFANILKKCFNTSMVCRLHGDEFAILTHLSEEEIEKVFDVVNQEIIESVEREEIPIIFEYNGGSCQVTDDLDLSMDKADCMMYAAKKANCNYQRYDECLWQERLNNNRMLSNIDSCIKEDEFVYAKRKLHYVNREDSDIIQLNVNDSNGNPIFQNISYEFIRNTFQGIRIDLNNILFFAENIKLFAGKVLITLDYATLMNIEDLVAYLNMLHSTYGIDFKKVILSINMLYIEKSHYSKMLEIINILRSYGIQICIDQYTCSEDFFLLESRIDYLKFSTKFWKNAMTNSKYEYYLQKKIDLIDNFNGNQSIPICICVDNEEELSFLQAFLPNYSLIGGNLLSQDEVITRKRIKPE